MKRRLTALWATALCVCGLMMAACSGGVEEKSAPTEGPAATEDAQDDATKKEGKKQDASQSVLPDPAEKFYGTWTLASMRSGDLTMVNDFGASSDQSMGLVIDEGGTARLIFDGETVPLAWEQKDDDTLLLIDESARPFDDEDVNDLDDDDDNDLDDLDDGSDLDDAPDADDVLGEGLLNANSLELVYEDKALTLAITSEDFDGTLTFTSNGALEDYPRLDNVKTKEFDDADEMVGTWHMSAFCMDGITMYGTPEALAARMEMDFTLVLDADGTAHLLDSTFSWSLSDSGASLTIGDQTIPLRKTAQGWMILDMTEAMGEDEAVLVGLSQ